MDYFGLEVDVAGFEARLPLVRDGERVVLLTTLAWYMRQRNTQRALRLVDEAELLLAQLPDPQEQLRREGWAARLRATRAEAHHLFGETEIASAVLIEAREQFAAIGDLVGMGDTHLLDVALANELGLPERRAEALAQACELFQRAEDPVRQHLAEIWVARDSMMVDDRAAEARWGALLFALTTHGHPGIEAFAAEFWGHMGLARSDYGQALEQFQRSAERAQVAGMRRLACFALGNMGAAYCNLGDVARAFEVTEQALTLARETAWPIMIGVSLLQAANALADHGPSPAQADAARKLLEEAVKVLKPFRQSRIYAGACQLLGDLMYRRADYAQGLSWHVEALQVSQRLSHPLLVASALRGQSLALSGLGRASEAMAVGEQALEAARETRDLHRQFEVLGTLAEIARQHAIPAPEGAEAPSGAIYYQQQALRVAAKIDDFTVPGPFLSDISSAYEAVGDLRLALDFERRAAASRARTHSKEATHLATAMQVRYDTERAKADAQHQRELAANEALRTAALQATNAMLERLAQIGQEITATLDADVVCHALYRHVRDMLQASAVEIWLVDGPELARHAGSEHGFAGPLQQRLALDHPIASIAQCAREQTEISDDGSRDASVPGLRLPLVAGGQVLGVLAVRPAQDLDFGERERQVLRSLSAYGAVALSNAVANRALAQRAQQDGLTALANRGHFDVILLSEIDRARRYGKPLSLLLCDVDHFKGYNDRYGHLAGDHCLQQVGQAMRNTCRACDTPARYGGEEFALILPETNEMEARVVAERLRHAVEALQIEHAASATAAHVTISVGVVTYAGDGETSAHELVGCADQSLYAAKRNGRNRCVESSQLMAAAALLHVAARVVPVHGASA
jgi:diguanylate cyclase (GGDEF)-like protein